jgi:ParB-like chromosome segregation protein Spo0J
MQHVAIKNIKPNPRNPRTIRDERFEKLKKSIAEFPEMLEKRPLVCFTDVDGKLVVLGGNMRLKAAQAVGLKELPVVLADDWTEEQKNEFLIKDNVGFGEWQWEALQADWDVAQLEEWGLDVPEFDGGETDYSDKNKELNVDDFENQSYTIKLEFTEDDYNFVKEKIQELGQSPEKILYDALVSL